MTSFEITGTLLQSDYPDIFGRLGMKIMWDWGDGCISFVCQGQVYTHVAINDALRICCQLVFDG